MIKKIASKYNVSFGAYDNNWVNLTPATQVIVFDEYGAQGSNNFLSNLN